MKDKYKIILTGILLVGIFSRYIFGDNNTYEEVAECILKSMTGKDINFSPTEEFKLEEINR